MAFKNKKYLLVGVSVVALGLSMSTNVSAQLAIPDSAAVGRSGQSVPKPDFGQVNSPQINIPEVRNDNAPNGAENIKFTLNSINLEGVTAYNVAQLQQIWADKIGTQVSLDDVYNIAQQVTRHYRSDGYIITQAIIPQQTIDDGNVTIRVVEGYIDSVSVDGDGEAFAADRVMQLANNLTHDRPLTAKELERWLLLVNDIPGLSARSIISPSDTAIGGADLVIIPTVDPYSFSFNLDNYGTRFLGPLQASAAVQFNNIFNAAETFQAQFVTDPDDNERLYAFTRFSMPVNSYGTNFGIDYTYSDTEPGFELAIFDVEGQSSLIGVDLKHPFIRTRTQNLFGSLRFDYRDLTSTNNVDAFETQDKIAAFRAGLDYSIFDNLWRPAVNEASFTLSQGVDFFNASDEGDANLTRANGDPQFTKLEASISRLQNLSPEFSLYTGLAGQISNNPLLSSEEFGAGGRAFGRGYSTSEIVGDDGFGATAELRWNPNFNNQGVDGYELFTFYDFGKIWNQETDINNLETQSIASIGLGARVDFAGPLSGEVLLAEPLTKDVTIYDNRNTKLLFSVGADF